MIDEPVELRADAHPEAAAESAALLDRLSVALDELPPKLRVLVVLKDVYGLSHEEIAEELGISVSAAKVRLHRGRKRLRDLLYDDSPGDGRWAHAV
jgi:RNA polymerase sigma-70 factor (ECF subfamily)